MARSQRGFTILEVLVAMTVLAVTGLLVARAFIGLMQVTGRSSTRTIATALAVRILEEYRASVDGQATSRARVASFDGIPPTAAGAFPVPYSRYAWSLTVNQVDLSPPSAHPCWLTGDPPAGCSPIADHPNTLKWLTVRVSVDGQNIAAVSSALIRDMHRGP
jgi:prepilin-type N-terminal cleavage/methylation domain-containing protein